MFSYGGYRQRLDGSTVVHRKSVASNAAQSGNGTQEARAKVPTR